MAASSPPAPLEKNVEVVTAVMIHFSVYGTERGGIWIAQMEKNNQSKGQAESKEASSR